MKERKEYANIYEHAITTRAIKGSKAKSFNPIVGFKVTCFLVISIFTSHLALTLLLIIKENGDGVDAILCSLNSPNLRPTKRYSGMAFATSNQEAVFLGVKITQGEGNLPKLVFTSDHGR
ncbi:hypothetical protein CRYUN_Cryun17cG0137900 [Craigia yunnanensis]